MDKGANLEGLQVYSTNKTRIGFKRTWSKMFSTIFVEGTKEDYLFACIWFICGFKGVELGLNGSLLSPPMCSWRQGKWWTSIKPIDLLEQGGTFYERRDDSILRKE